MKGTSPSFFSTSVPSSGWTIYQL